jgi:hypothetical protein
MPGRQALRDAVFPLTNGGPALRYCDLAECADLEAAAFAQLLQPTETVG